MNKSQENGKVLVVGGAGYIGSHVVFELTKSKVQALVLDDLSNGHREAVKGCELVVGCVTDSALLQRVFEAHKISGVIHFAGRAEVGESVKDPIPFYRGHVAGTLALVTAMRNHGVNNLVFSSSCAVYGDPAEVPITEDHPKEPLSPYGRCKLVAEELLQDAYGAYGLRSVSLRYFNAAGANWKEGLGEDHDPETHLIPKIMATVLANKAHTEGRREAQPEPLPIYGNDYPTPDGTCIRDYIHVIDLAHAHLLALDWLERGGPTTAINLGSEKGASVQEVVETVEAVTGIPVPTKVVARRPGDPPRLVASSRKAGELLGWEPVNSDLHHIVETAWRWHESHPAGFSTGTTGEADR